MYLERRRRAQTRTTQLGTWAHGLTGQLLEENRDFSAEELYERGQQYLNQKDPANNSGPRLGELITAVNIALRHRPFEPWELLGTEMRLGDGAVDAVFWLPAFAAGGDGQRFLIDEYKLCRFPGDLPAATPQVLDYMVAAKERWGAGLIGIRLIALTYDTTSLFWAADTDQPVPLPATDYWFDRPLEMVA